MSPTLGPHGHNTDRKTAPKSLLSDFIDAKSRNEGQDRAQPPTVQDHTGDEVLPTQKYTDRDDMGEQGGGSDEGMAGERPNRDTADVGGKLESEALPTESDKTVYTGGIVRLRLFKHSRNTGLGFPHRSASKRALSEEEVENGEERKDHEGHKKKKARASDARRKSRRGRMPHVVFRVCRAPAKRPDEEMQ